MFKIDEFYLELSTGEIKLGKELGPNSEAWGLKIVEIPESLSESETYFLGFYEEYFLGFINGKIQCFERCKEIEP